MSPPYSNNFKARRNPFDNDRGSALNHVLRSVKRLVSRAVSSAYTFSRGNGAKMAAGFVTRTVWHVRRNLTRRRLLSFPHLIVLLWLLVLLRGERWLFHWKVEQCKWHKWEDWPKDANPHHLIFVADPQLIDPKSYPSRPWPISDLTPLVVDNYIRRSYNELQGQLRPDSLFFLGDLFDGGREWKTANGDFNEASWARPYPANEKKYAKMWKKKYGHDYWLEEYKRFSNIFFKPYHEEGGQHGAGKKGRKLVASLPGNHDLGFGSMIKVPVRDRFSAFFGEPNRVDVVGNHTIVSVDTVSLSAGTSEQARTENLKHIYGPADEFLKEVQSLKRKAVLDQLRFLRGDNVESQLNNNVLDASKLTDADFADPKEDKNANVADFPTILLTHVPLYRDPGTPCGPMRERWPPSKPVPTDAAGRVVDHRNAISVSAGYQYQNVLSEEDSVKIVSSVGNVKRVFSGDDHDYCELTHSGAKNNAVEITVKSISMAMGIPTPGFVMVSMWNPIDESGKSLRGGEPTMQTHLCLLPNQFRTFVGYGFFVIVSLSLISIRAFLVSFLGLPAFAHSLNPSSGPSPSSSSSSYLPVYKEKRHDEDPPTYSSSSNSSYPNRLSSLSASRTRNPVSSADLARDPTTTTSSSSTSSTSSSTPSAWKSKRKSSKFASSSSSRWGWGGGGHKQLRIQINNDFYDSGKSRSLWRAASGRRRSVELKVVVREFVAMAWRVVWMAGLIWAYLNWRG
ncbi:Cell division control protein [Scedosporium apiospermum]|uniref:Cell division control protein n=1 Tax=Pseudallescheria apiosperma TaxID=563466 RepID=A0A084G4N7_PSEDA|nr:Cell division control protein [Scedosporium apiospermum]KEZ42299.1 Cell division control protein [Scedosporium apiospermum]